MRHISNHCRPNRPMIVSDFLYTTTGLNCFLKHIPYLYKIRICTLVLKRAVIKACHISYNVQQAVPSFKSISHPPGTTVPSRLGPPRYQSFTITLKHITFGRTPLDEWKARCTDLHLTTYNSHKRQNVMPLAGFEPATPVGEQPQTHATWTAQPLGSNHSSYRNLKCQTNTSPNYTHTSSIEFLFTRDSFHHPLTFASGK